MFVYKPVDNGEVSEKQLPHPQLFGLALLVVLKFAHIFLQFLYLGLRSNLFVLGHLYGFLEIFDDLFGRFDIISDLYVMD